jgi:pimeloyl-ACP methyl ester carboxylesterase
MRLFLTALAAALLCATAADARVAPFPSSSHTQQIPVSGGATQYVRVGGHGPAVLLLHGFGDTGDMWQPLAMRLMANHTVIVPDLRGMGLSSHPDDGYTKAAQGEDIARILDVLHVESVQLVTHDIGNMVGFAFAMEHRDRVSRWVVMDAPLPGIGHWDDQLRNPKTWHFNFHGPDEERLLQGRERIFLDRFYNELSAHPENIDVQTRAHYAALYARPHAMHDALEQFVAFRQDGVDNIAFVRHGVLTMPVLAIGGAASYGPHLADEMRFVADNVQGISIPESGHWLMEEQPEATMTAILAFIQ